jgi:hypothetical protein
MAPPWHHKWCQVNLYQCHSSASPLSQGQNGGRPV